MQDTVVHAIEGYPHKTIVLLQPTSPLRLAKDIDKCIEIYMREKPYSVITVRTMTMFSPFIPNGAVYVLDRNTVKKLKNQKWHNDDSLLVVMPRERSVDVDTEVDFLLCETLMRKRYGK